FLDSTRPLNNERTSSSLVYWIVSPPVTRETGDQFPDGERAPDLLSFFGPGLSRGKDKSRASCIGRESNPGLPRGRREFYHYTNEELVLFISWPFWGFSFFDHSSLLTLKE